MGVRLKPLVLTLLLAATLMSGALGTLAAPNTTGGVDTPTFVARPCAGPPWAYSWTPGQTASVTIGPTQNGAALKCGSRVHVLKHDTSILKSPTMGDGPPPAREKTSRFFSVNNEARAGLRSQGRVEKHG